MDQDALNAAARAAVEFIIQNPVQGINMAPAVNIYHMLQTLRKYNGSYAATHWLRDFNRERVTYNLDATWAVQNLDRVLEATPLVWWNARKADFLNRLAVQGAVPNDIWTEVENSLRQFFNESNIRDRARTELNTIRFAIGQDPMDYVARKTECMMRYNPNMEVEDQIKNLLLGLPENLRALVSPSDINTVDQFFRKLSQQVHLHRRKLERSVGFQSQGPANDMQARDFRAFQSRGAPVGRAGQTNRPRGIHGLQIPTFSEEHKAQCVTQDGTYLCWYCKRPGHSVRLCRTLAREQNIEVPNGNRNNNNFQRRINNNQANVNRPVLNNDEEEAHSDQEN